MRWIVGIDLHPHSHGAMRIAAWLHRQTHEHELIGVHVVERPPLLSAMHYDPPPLDELVGLSRQSLEGAVDEVDAGGQFLELVAMLADEPERGLTDACSAKDADALLIGRRKPREGRALMPLGRVARRLLRELPVPVMVVPPNLRGHEIGSGPVIAAIDLSPASSAACRVARDLAASLERDFVVAHVVAEVSMYAPPYIPRITNETLATALRDVAVKNTSEWLERHGFAPTRAIIETGSTVEQLCSIAEREDAFAMTCGSRLLTLGERVFQSSVGSHLAAQAKCGVLVVPPPDRA